MTESNAEIWDAHFYSRSPLFMPLMPAAQAFLSLPGWPTLDDYVKVFRASGSSIKPVPQAGKPQHFDQLYESRVYLKGELQTRLHNWHDFFNALVWLRFPQTKSVLNELHYVASLQREGGSNRSPLENAITLFDECGAVVISDDEQLLQMVRNHEWKQLFVEHRSRFETDIRCIVFGHAMYEKAMRPYVGMTTNTLLIHSSELLLADLADIDSFIAREWKQGRIKSTRDLRPLPLLGVPGWYADNASPGFYDDTDYFRPRR